MVFSVQILGRLQAAVLKHGLAAAAVMVGAAALTGCGQKGPLFLPVPPVAPPATQTVATPAIAAPAPPASTPR